MKRLTVAEIKAIAEKYSDDYGVVAIRTQEFPFELGDMDHESNIWDDGDDTGEGLGGVCATNATSSAVSMHSNEWAGNTYGYYFGDHQAVIVGDRYEYGNDYGEVIIQDPIVVEIIF